MSTTLTVSNFKASVGWDFESVNSFAANTTNNNTLIYSTTTSNGTGNGKAQFLYSTQQTIAGSAGTYSFALTSGGSGPVTDFFGNTITMSKVKGIYVQHLTPTAGGTLTLGGNFIAGVVLTGTTPLLIMQPGQVLLLGGSDSATDNGWAVTTSTHDVVTVTNNGSISAVVNIFILGE